MSGWDFPPYPESQPRAVSGGIKAKTNRGAFAENWWSKRWIAVLESFNLGARLTRGRRYARQGQVASIDIQPGLVLAKVQGSRKKPYRVTIGLVVFTQAQWEKIMAHLLAEPLLVASLLAGQMPDNIEAVFDQVGLSLFPQKIEDLGTDCSCPDWSNPCKHIAAVYYLLGEEFDRDPFLIFRLRGLDRAELTAMLAAGAEEADFHQDEAWLKLVAEPELDRNRLLDPKAFWHGEPPAAVPVPLAEEIKGYNGLLKQVGELPFWQGDEPLLSALEPIYKQASSAARKLYQGEEGED